MNILFKGIRKLYPQFEILLHGPRYYRIYRAFKAFTMVRHSTYVINLYLADRFRHVPGCVVECGVWKGGMSAGMARLLGPARRYYLYDSFEGLPPAQELDGAAARAWQADPTLPHHENNNSADQRFAEEAMARSGATDYRITKGWFKDTLPGFNDPQGIAILRLDGDWYDSTMQALDHLYPRVVRGGLIIVDDYYMWEGCSKAVHDFLSKNKLPDRVYQSYNTVGYLIKS